MQEEWLEGKRVVGISSGASAPEELVQRLVDFFRERGTEDVSEFEVVQEDVRFMLPKEIQEGAGGARRELEAVQAQARLLRHHRPVRLVEPRLARRRPTAPPRRRRP